MTFDKSHGPLWKRLAPDVPTHRFSRGGGSSTTSLKTFFRQERARLAGGQVSNGGRYPRFFAGRWLIELIGARDFTD